MIQSKLESSPSDLQFQKKTKKFSVKTRFPNILIYLSFVLETFKEIR
jgi:hypothetical protein